MPANKRRFRIPAGVTLRECSVIIIGSRCKICGRDFKCESDVILHRRWRHNTAIGPLIESLNNENYFQNIGQNCDICDIYFVNISDLKIHKRLIHKHKRKKKLRKETVHVTFKLQGVTIMDVNLDRKYLKVQDNFRYVVDADTQTPNWFEEHPDDCAANIDLFVRDPVDNSHIEYGIWPHKANRYIVRKFASTKDDTIACSTNIVGRSFAKILNMPHTISDNNDSYKEYEIPHDSTSKEHSNVLLENLIIHDKENSPKIDNAYSKEQERKKAHYQSNIPNNSKEFLMCQSNKSDQIVSPIPKQNSWSSKNCHDFISRSNKVAGYKESAGLTSSVIDSAEITIDNKNNNVDDTTKKHTLSRNNGKKELLKANSNIDDDVQEVLRITRGSTQNDINHESPNRTEREILVQNSAELYMLSIQEKSNCSEKCNAGFTTNVESSNYLPFTTITESSYQFLANTFDKKLGIYLEDLHHYGIRCYENLSEINNNNLEIYPVYDHQDFLDPWMQAAKSQYTNGLRANDNEAIVVLD